MDGPEIIMLKIFGTLYLPVLVRVPSNQIVTVDLG